MASASDPKTPPRQHNDASAGDTNVFEIVKKVFKSTPMKVGLTDISQDKATMDFHLKDNLTNRILVTSLEKYVEEVLCTPYKKFEERLAKSWSTVKEELKDDIDAYLGAQREKDYYKPFERIVNRILERAETVLQEEIVREGCYVLSMPNSNPNRKRRSKRRRKGVRTASYWEDIFLIMELKKKATEEEILEAVSSEGVSILGQSGTSSGSIPISVASSTRSSKLNPSRQSSASRSKQNPRTSQSHDSFESQQESKGYAFRMGEVGVLSSLEGSTSSKRKASSMESSRRKRIRAEYIASEDPAAKITRLNAEEQLANYAMESFSDTGLRSHSLGMLVTDNMMNLWYFDREGCIKTPSFDFIANFEYFATIMVSFLLLNAHQWGFHPFLNIPPGITPHMGEDDTAVTMVVEDVEVRLTGLIHQQYGLVGRGTAVYCAEVIGGQQEVMTGSTVVVKSSWQAITRPREAETIKTAHERRNKKDEYRKCLDNLPKVYASDEGIKLSTLRNKLLNRNEDGYEDRIIRNVLMPQYESIWDLSLRMFVKVIREVFLCHYALWICGILHRDISINNVMCLKVGDEYIGILLDFDLAVILDDKGNPPEQKSKFRTGTLMFMAIDLLNKVEGPHLYRYDLESLLYVMIWRSCSYVDDEGRINTGLTQWLNGSYSQLHTIKHSLLTGETLSNLPLLDEFKPILSWFYPLVDLFYDGLSARRKRVYGLDAIKHEDSEDSTLYGHVTHEKFWTIIEKDLDYSAVEKEKASEELS